MTAVADLLAARARRVDLNSIDLGPSHDAADLLHDIAEGLDAAHLRAADGYIDSGEHVPDALLLAFARVEEAADRLRTAAVLMRGHVGPQANPF